jgi:hypothetical protein
MRVIIIKDTVFVPYLFFSFRILNLDGNEIESLDKSAFGKLPVVSGTPDLISIKT